MRLSGISQGLLLAITLVISANGMETYKPDWDDLNRYPQADWLNEAKFGLYWHWNYNSVAGHNGWYGRNMYDESSYLFRHHSKTHGDPATFGYKDFAPLFTADRFSAKQWVEDSERIGARFIVGMAVHHDGFDMYDSSFTPWNSVDKPPHIDVIGELAKEARKQGMKFGATSHLAWNWKFFSSFMYPDRFDAGQAPELYNIHDPAKGASPEWASEWYKRTTELIDKYELDFLWFDFGTMDPAIRNEYTAKLTAHFYNRSIEWNKTVALATKVGFENRKSQVHDVEHGKFGYIRYPQWMSDSTMNRGWFYLGGEEDPERMKGEYWLYQLIDMVSKNGTLLLNLGPKPDGSWPEEWKRELFKMGDWLKLNGEAVYGTRPWHRYGEGPTHDGDAIHYQLGRNLTGDDIRFTRKDNVLYAIVCGWREQAVDVRSLGRKEMPEMKVSRVSMLGSPEEIKWAVKEDALSIQFPEEAPCEFAYVFRIEGEGLFPKRVSEYLPIEIHPPNQEVAALRISLPGEQQQLAVAEVVATAVGKKTEGNLAPKGTVTLSSSETASALAVDGNKNGHPNMQSVARTRWEQNPWLMLTLEQPVNLKSVKIFAGQESFKAFAENGLVEGLDTGGKVVFSIKITDCIDKHVVKTSYLGVEG